MGRRPGEALTQPNPTQPPLDPPTWLELAIWALAAPGKFFEPGKFAKHLISLHLFTFKMLTMSSGMPCHISSSAGREVFADSQVHLLEYGTVFHLL